MSDREAVGEEADAVAESGEAVQASGLRATLHQCCLQFSSLKGSPRELWFVYLLKFIESYAYFSFSIIFSIYLTDEFGYSDLEAGVAYGLWGSITTGVGILMGFVIDNLGVRKSLLVSFVLLTVARLMVALTGSQIIIKICIYCLLPIGQCMGIPVLLLAIREQLLVSLVHLMIRRYTTSKNRGFAFGLFYAMMNVAALLSGWVVDALNIGLKDGAEIFGQHLSGNRLVLLTGVFFSVVGLVLSIFGVREIKVSEEASDSVEDFSPVVGSPLQILRQLWASPYLPLLVSVIYINVVFYARCCNRTFWRFAAFTLITINLKMVFRHLDATLPKYLVREFGETAPKGTIYSINPAMIIVLVPLVAAFSQRQAHFDMIHYGSYITGISCLPMVLSTSIPAAVLFVGLLSLGEAIWSPRFYDYTVSVAPEGREGTFMALASAPLFAAKLPVGAISGLLLATYCPAEGPRNSGMMWLIIGALTFSSPVLITLTQRWIREPAALVYTAFDNSTGIDVELEEQACSSDAAASDDEPTGHSAKNEEKQLLGP